MRRRLITCLPLAIAGIALPDRPRAQALEEVTYLLPAPPTTTGFIPFMIAQQRGYYAAEGLKVNFLSGKGGLDVAKQVGAGNVPIGGAIGDTAIIARAQGIPVKLVALLGGKPYHHVQLITDAGIKDIRGLRGKTLNVMSYQDTSYMTLLGVLAGEGMSKSDLSIEAAGPAGVWQTAVAGRAVGFVGPMAWAVDAEAAGKKVTTIESDRFLPSMAQAILASDAMIEKRPELIAKLVKATLRGVQDIINDPKGVVPDFIAASPTYKGRDGRIAEQLRLDIKYTYSGAPKLGWIDADRVKVLQEFYFKQGLIPKATPVDALYTNQFVPESATK
jgi:NitT/TauT family transport system substrate-binding protein